MNFKRISIIIIFSLKNTFPKMEERSNKMKTIAGFEVIYGLCLTLLRWRMKKKIFEGCRQFITFYFYELMSTISIVMFVNAKALISIIFSPLKMFNFTSKSIHYEHLPPYLSWYACVCDFAWSLKWTHLNPMTILLALYAFTVVFQSGQNDYI